MDTILQTPFVQQIILPFLLVFTLIFAILQKTKILGDGKKQIDAIVAFVVGLIFVSFSRWVGIATNLLGLMALVAVVILVFLLLYGFASNKDSVEIPDWLKYIFMGIIALILIIALMYFTGVLDNFLRLFKSDNYNGNAIVMNIIFGVIIIAAIAIVLWSGKSSDKKKD